MTGIHIAEISYVIYFALVKSGSQHIYSGDNWCGGWCGNWCGRLGLRPFRSLALSVCGRSGLWPFRLVAISVCGRFGLWPFRSPVVPVCGRFGLWLFRFLAVSVVAFSVCGRYDQLPHEWRQITSTHNLIFCDAGTKNWPIFAVKGGLNWRFMSARLDVLCPHSCLSPMAYTGKHTF